MTNLFVFGSEISYAMKPTLCKFLLSYSFMYAYFELYPFLHIYVKLSQSEISDLPDLCTFYLLR